jgi:thiol-disulfide isomerase/thioredoxin
MIKPIYEELAKTYGGDAVFASLDVDQVKESAAMAKVTAMPTFQFYKGGKMIHEIKGANKQGLEMIIKVCIF